MSSLESAQELRHHRERLDNQFLRMGSSTDTAEGARVSGTAGGSCSEDTEVGGEDEKLLVSASRACMSVPYLFYGYSELASCRSSLGFPSELLDYTGVLWTSAFTYHCFISPSLHAGAPLQSHSGVPSVRFACRR